MTAFTATFSNGKTISLKNSAKAFTHAWMVTSDDRDPMTGWASSEALAREAAQSVVTSRTIKPTRGHWGQYYRNRTFTPALNTRSEIVPALAQ